MWSLKTQILQPVWESKLHLSSPSGALPHETILRDILNLYDVTEALLTEDILEEDQVFFMVSIRKKLRGKQGQSLMQPFGSDNNQKDDSKPSK